MREKQQWTAGPTAPFQQVDRTYIVNRGRKFTYFGGCDYFRMASHPEVLRAVRAGLDRYGLNVAASRITTGEHELYPKLEKTAARFFGAEAAVLISTGYGTNMAAAQGLSGEIGLALMDERCHASLRDALVFLECPIRLFRHRSPEDLKRLLARHESEKPVLVATDGMFSQDGSVAPLRAYLKCLPRSGKLLVDDAHAAGVIGAHGGGSVELEGTGRERVVQTVTFSKAFGAYGGAVLCSRDFRGKIWSKSRLAVGNTPLPLPLAQASIRAIELVRGDDGFKKRLDQNKNWVKEQLEKRGWNREKTPGPVIGWASEDLLEIERLKKELRKRDIFPPFVRYPGSGRLGGFRFVISSEHSKEQLGRLVEGLEGF